jgi:aspartate/glutamate racemase
MLNLIAAKAMSEVTDDLSEEMQRLARAGADVGLFAANTPHIVFDDLQRRSPIPLISIVEATREAADELGLRSLGLFVSDSQCKVVVDGHTHGLECDTLSGYKAMRYLA